MVLSFIKYLSGYVRVQVTGYAPERFLNLCSNHDILIWDLVHIESGYEFFISLSGVRELKPFLKKTKTHLRILKRYGFPFVMFRYRKRKLFFGGIAVFFLFLFFLSRFIWNIEILGNSSVTDDNLLQFLEAEHCGFGVAKKEIDCSGLEEKIRLHYGQIIWTSAQISGTKLTIRVKENLITGEKKDEKKEEPRDLIAACDGTVLKMITRTGTPLIQEQAKVKKGEVLVSGRIDLIDDNQEVSGYEYCRADADIQIETKLPYQDTFSLSYEKKHFTGNQKKRYAIELFGHIYPAPMGKVTYPKSEKTTEYRQPRLCSDFYLPVILRTDRYAEYQITSEKYTKKEAKAIAESHLQAYFKKIQEKDVQIQEKNVIIDVNDNLCSAKGTITVCGPLYQTAPVAEPEKPADERVAADELE